MILPALEEGFYTINVRMAGLKHSCIPEIQILLSHLKSSEGDNIFHVLISSRTLGIPGSLEENSQEW